MLGHFDEIYRRFDRLEQEHHAITRRYAASRHSSPTSVEGARSSSAISRS
jgi:hypothetical protein